MSENHFIDEKAFQEEIDALDEHFQKRDLKIRETKIILHSLIDKTNFIIALNGVQKMRAK